MKTNKSWTSLETRYLKWYWRHCTDEQIGKRLNRTAEAIKQKRRQLGLRKLKRWTDEDDARLLANKHLPASELAEELGRSAIAVNQRAQRLGVGVGSMYWQKDQVEFLHKFYKTMTCSAMAKKLDRTPRAVQAKCRREGLLFKRNT
jgi:hypothetical protein